MKSCICLVASVLLFDVALTAQSASLASFRAVPDSIGDQRAEFGRPAWVSAETAIGNDGRLRPAYFSAAVRHQIERNQEKNSNGTCNAFVGAPPLDHYKPVGSLDVLVGNSLSIVTGEVTASRDGFYLGTPGKLFSIRPESYLKAFGRIRTEGHLYIFVPETKIATSRGAICSTAGAGSPSVGIGDRIVAFSYLNPVDDERAILPVDVKSQLVVEKQARLWVPDAFRSQGVGKFDDLVFAIRANRRLADIPSEVK